MEKNCKNYANQTRDQLDKHDLGKKLQNLGKKQTNANKKRKKCKQNAKKMQIRPGTNWTNMISEAKCKNLGKMQEKCEKMQTALFHQHFSCIFDLHFFCITWCFFSRLQFSRIRPQGANTMLSILSHLGCK